MTPAVAAFWQKFLQETNRPADTPCFEVFPFGDSKELADSLLALVLSGAKRATASSGYVYCGENSLKVGDLSIVTDWEGNPVCVTETIQLQTIPFRELTFETVRREGEDDSLESWQKGHIAFYTREGQQLGYEFSWDMPVVFEDFAVRYPVPD